MSLGALCAAEWRVLGIPCVVYMAARPGTQPELHCGASGWVVVPPEDSGVAGCCLAVGKSGAPTRLTQSAGLGWPPNTRTLRTGLPRRFIMRTANGVQMHGQARKRCHVTRGLFRLWLVATTFWIAAISFTFWSSNGGAGARWVWSGTKAERASVAGQQWTPENLPSVAEGAAEIAASKTGNRKGMSWEEFENLSAPPVIISQQLPAFLFLALALPAFVLVFGASLAWAIKGF